jgi:hypothetical protein
MIGCGGGTGSGMTLTWVAGAERRDGMPVETDVDRGALQWILKRDMAFEMKASTRQQFELAEMGVSRRHGRQLRLCLIR